MKDKLILFSLMVLVLLTPIALAQTQSHPLSQISPINTNLNMSLSGTAYNITNINWITYSGGIVYAGTRGIPTTDIQDSAVTSSKIASGVALTGNVSIDSPTFFVDSTNNNVGIGTTSPMQTLTVVGTFNTTDNATLGTSSSNSLTVGGGAGKINAGTIDPIYDIYGVRYATYLAGMTGIKEETTGTVRLNGKKYTIDFDEVEVGSDLWLFSQITDFGNNWKNLVVILTPDSPQRIWYEKNTENNELIFYGETDGEVSFRLTAPRFDHFKWSNLAAEQEIKGIIVK